MRLREWLYLMAIVAVVAVAVGGGVAWGIVQLLRDLSALLGGLLR